MNNVHEKLEKIIERGRHRVKNVERKGNDSRIVIANG